MAKYIDTPVGKFEMPNAVAERLDGMTDIELLEDYVKNCKNFIDPFLFQEMADRKLIFAGDYYADIVKRLEELKSTVVPTKELLEKKISDELTAFEKNASIAGGGDVFASEYKIREAFSNALRNTPLSDEMIAILYKKENVLFDMNDFYARTNFPKAGISPDDFYEVAHRYLEKQERHDLSVKLMNKIESEWSGRLYDLRQELPNKIYETAKEIYLCSEIVSALSYDIDFSVEQLKALAAMETPLSELYDECLRNDLDLSETVLITIQSKLQNQANNLNMAEWDNETETDYEQEGLDEV